MKRRNLALLDPYKERLGIKRPSIDTEPFVVDDDDDDNNNNTKTTINNNNNNSNNNNNKEEEEEEEPPHFSQHKFSPLGNFIIIESFRVTKNEERILEFVVNTRGRDVCIADTCMLRMPDGVRDPYCSILPKKLLRDRFEFVVRIRKGFTIGKVVVGLKGGDTCLISPLIGCITTTNVGRNRSGRILSYLLYNTYFSSVDIRYCVDKECTESLIIDMIRRLHNVLMDRPMLCVELNELKVLAMGEDYASLPTSYDAFESFWLAYASTRRLWRKLNSVLLQSYPNGEWEESSICVGYMCRAKAEEELTQREPGTFLVRFGSDGGGVVISYITPSSSSSSSSSNVHHMIVGVEYFQVFDAIVYHIPYFVNILQWDEKTSKLHSVAPEDLSFASLLLSNWEERQHKPCKTCKTGALTTHGNLFNAALEYVHGRFEGVE